MVRRHTPKFSQLCLLFFLLCQDTKPSGISKEAITYFPVICRHYVNYATFFSICWTSKSHLSKNRWSSRCGNYAKGRTAQVFLFNSRRQHTKYHLILKFVTKVRFLGIDFHKQYCDYAAGWTSGFEDGLPMRTETFSYATRPHHIGAHRVAYLMGDSRSFQVSKAERGKN